MLNPTLNNVLAKAIAKAFPKAKEDKSPEVKSGSTVEGTIGVKVRFSANVGDQEIGCRNTAAENKALAAIGLLALQRLNADCIAAVLADYDAGKVSDYAKHERVKVVVEAIKSDPERFDIKPVDRAGKTTFVIKAVEHFRFVETGKETLTDEAKRSNEQRL